MKKKNLLFLTLILLCANFATAQTWDGSEGTDWNTPGNWNSNAVPLPAGAVTIPGDLTNYPVLASNVTINNIDMQDGSSLDFNGYNLTVTGISPGFCYFIGATLNNSKAATDIVVNITLNGGYYAYMRNAIVNDNISINLGGTANFYDGDIGNSGNHFTGDLTITAAGTGALSLSNGDTSRYDGNVIISRPGAGVTSAFSSGAIIGGNFNFTNNTAGNTYFGSVGNKTSVAGIVNISINDTVPSAFEMIRVINSTNGGLINVQNSLGFNVQNDTLLLNSVSITGYRGSSFGFLYNNKITGNVVIADDVSGGGGYYTYVRNNTVTGNATFTMNGTNNFYDGDVGNSGNHYTGNVVVTGAGIGAVSISNGDTSRFDGNLTITRPGAGTTSAFGAGAVIGGNFSFTNNTAGNSYFGNISNKTTVAGTVNISINDTVPSVFELLRVINSTNGGTINVQNSLGFNVQNDTLLLNSVSITGYRGASFGFLYNNKITGNIAIADDVSGGGGYYTYVRNNTVTGNATFTMNGTNNFYDGDVGNSGNHYTGNVVVTGAGIGAVSISNGDTSRFDGNLTITRPGAGNTSAFGSGAIIGGNFSFTNNTTGPSSFGSAGYRTTVGGTVNISINNTAPAAFELIRMINSTNGGTINVQNSLGFNVQNDTLLLNSVSITGYRGASFGFLYDNRITGNVVIADNVSAGGGYYTYIRNNTVTGDVDFTNNGSNNFYDGDVGNSGNRYSGNVSYSTAGSPVNIGADTTEIGGNLVVNSTTNVTFANIKLNGSASSNIEQLGSQPIVIPQLIIEKGAAAIISLNDPVTVSTKLFFNGGHIASSPANYLQFADNANYTGASDVSHVKGPVFKAGNDAFIFPVGDGTILKAAAITASAFATDVFSAEYLKTNPDLAGYDTSAFGGSILRVSGYEYWNVKRESGTSNVTLTLSYTDPGSGDYITVPADARIARWTGSTWQDLGNSASTGTTAGTVTSGAAVTNFTPGPFTFGSTNLQTNALLDVILYTYYADTDSDTFGDAANSITSPSTTAPAGYVANSTDCDDNDNTVYPGAPELCDNKDNDCDGVVDNGVTPPTFYRDLDGDGFGDPANSLQACIMPVGYVTNNTDCSDNDNTIYLGAPELCDGKDNDCDGIIDDGVGSTFCRDLDGDGFGDAANSQVACTAPVGYVSNNTDCDDNNNTVYPGAPELCDGLDNDCNGTVDDGAGTTPYYADTDGDGFGDPNVSITGCTIPPGYVANNTDCNDNDNTIYPGAPELCDGKDNDCNGIVDDGAGTTPYYADADGDGFGDPNVSVTGCNPPAGYVLNNTDCNDADNTIYPGAPELCDLKDNDCNGIVDDGAGTTPYYADADGDGFGDPNVSVTSCNPPAGYVLNNTDCNDANNTVYPGAPELCDGLDNDCNGIVDDGAGTTPYYADADGDGFGDPNVSVTGCNPPTGYVLNNTDCNDANNTVYPGAPELCDGLDNDCNGIVDDGAGTTLYYADADGDGFGDPNVSVTGCSIPPGYVTNNTDCNDANNTVYPGAPELCDGIDNDCDGTVDGPTTAPVVNGLTNMCPFEGTGEQVVFTVTPSAGVTSYQWIVPPTVNIVSGQGTGTLTVTILNGFGAAANKQIRVTATSACGVSPLAIHYLLSQTPSTPRPIIGPNEVCLFVGTGTEAIYKINSVIGATAYNWTSSAGITINSHPGGTGINDTIVTVLFAPTLIAGNISVTASNNCGASNNSRGISITNGLTPTPGFIEGPTNACLYKPSVAIPNGLPATYTIRKVANATSYSWSIPAGATATHPEGTGINDTIIVVNYSNGFTGGSIIVSANSSCAAGGSRSLLITTNLKPGAIAAISASETQSCPNHQVTYNVVTPPSTNWIEWTVPSNASIISGQGTNTIVVAYTIAVSGSVTATPSSGCRSGGTRTLQVNIPACGSIQIFTKKVNTINLQSSSLDVEVYPNPTQSEFHVSITSNSKEKIQVRLFDVNGKKFVTGISNPLQLNNFGSSLKAGVYLMEVTQGKTRKTTRLVKF